MEAIFADMEARGRETVTRGQGAADTAAVRAADMRYVGQGHEVSVRLPNGELSARHLTEITAAFEDTYKSLYGRKGPDVPFEIINWRVVASGPRPAMTLKLPCQDTRHEGALKEARQAYFPECGGYVKTAVFDRYALQPGMTFQGPAIVEEKESTLIVGAGGRATVDDDLNIMVGLTGGK